MNRGNKLIENPEIMDLANNVLSKDEPALVYFHDPNSETCEFAEDTVRRLDKDLSELNTVIIDTSKNPEIVELLSIPQPPVYLFTKSSTILGYKLGKVKGTDLQNWIEEKQKLELDKGTPVADFLMSLRELEVKQSAQAQKRLGSDRKQHIWANIFNMAAGGVLLALQPSTGFALMGAAIIAYHAYKTLQMQLDKTKTTDPANSGIGMAFEMAANTTGVIGSFGLLASAFALSSTGAAALGVVLGGFLMLNNGLRLGDRLGQYLPLKKILRGTLREMAEERMNRDPTKPLDEYSPPKVTRAELEEHAKTINSPKPDDGPK